MSEITTESDEAIVYWFMQYYVTGWETDQANKEKDVVEQTQPRKRRKKEGKHCSRTELGGFNDNLERISKARKDPITGNGWDDALQIEATRQQQLLEKGTSKEGNWNEDESAAPDHEGEDASLPVASTRYSFIYEPLQEEEQEVREV